MKYLKLFSTQTQYQSYIKNNWISPHIYKIQENKNVDYEDKYIPLEYISSTQTGGQYIDLGCHLMENTDDIKIDIKFNIKGVGKSSSGGDPNLATLISSQPEVSPWPGFILRRQAVDNYRIHLQTKWQFTNSAKRVGDAKYDSKYLSYVQSANNWISVDYPGIYEFTEILDNIPQSQVNDCTCTLFCALDSSNNPFRYCYADLYYLKFTKGETVVRDLVPVLNKRNIPGLYDKVNKKFYPSQGDTNFVAGPIKS